MYLRSLVTSVRKTEQPLHAEYVPEISPVRREYFLRMPRRKSHVRSSQDSILLE
jgi:hypothetical protein